MISKNSASSNQKHDRAAAAQIFLEYREFIREVICSYVQDEDQVDDLFHDSFISFTCYPLSQEIQDVEAYLYKVIINTIIRVTRREVKYRNCMHEYAKCSNHTENEQKVAEETFLQADELYRMFELIEKHLPRTEAQAVLLQYQEGRSAKEIAEIMNVANATARGYVSEGLKRLRRLLRDIEARAIK
jgi:RNA polymerase sigma factor (sigma-70 family)